METSTGERVHAREMLQKKNSTLCLSVPLFFLFLHSYFMKSSEEVCMRVQRTGRKSGSLEEKESAIFPWFVGFCP